MPNEPFHWLPAGVAMLAKQRRAAVFAGAQRRIGRRRSGGAFERDAVAPFDWHGMNAAGNVVFVYVVAHRKSCYCVPQSVRT